MCVRSKLYSPSERMNSLLKEEKKSFKMATAAASESFSNAQKSNSNHKNAKDDDDDDREMIAFPPSSNIISFSLSFQWCSKSKFLGRINFEKPTKLL